MRGFHRPDLVDQAGGKLQRGRLILRGFRSGGFRGFPAALRALRPSGDFPDHFGGPQRGDELLESMIVEFDAGALAIGFRDRANSILPMTNGLSCIQDLHCVLLFVANR